MGPELRFRRVLLKLSGEMLGDKGAQSLDPVRIRATAARIRSVVNLGVELAIVAGAGNLFRGRSSCPDLMTRGCADYVGMLATVMNALTLRDALQAHGCRTEVQSAIPMTGIADPFDARRADALLGDGTIVLFAGGTGHPYFTTDTTAALRACEIGADAILKGTKVDGVYSADPETHPEALRYDALTYEQALSQDLKVMDATAFSLCRTNDIPTVVFNFMDEAALRDIVTGSLDRATLVSNG